MPFLAVTYQQYPSTVIIKADIKLKNRSICFTDLHPGSDAVLKTRVLVLRHLEAQFQSHGLGLKTFSLGLDLVDSSQDYITA